MEHVDALADHVLDLDRQVILQGLQRLGAEGVHVIDLEVLGVAHHDPDRHALDHLGELGGLGIGPDLLGHDAPGEHGIDVVALGVVDGRDQEIEGLRADLDQRLVRQVLRIGDDPALVRGVLVEDVDAGADEVVGVDVDDLFQLLDRAQRRLVRIGDAEVLQVADHDVDRHILDHLAEVRVRKSASPLGRSLLLLRCSFLLLHGSLYFPLSL